MLCLSFPHVSGLCPIWAGRRIIALYLGRSRIDPNEQIFSSDSWCWHFPCLVGFIRNGNLLAGYLWRFCLSYISVRLIGDVLLSWESFGDGGICKRLVYRFCVCFVIAKKWRNRLFFPKTTSHNYVNIKNKEWMAQSHTLLWKRRNRKWGEKWSFHSV